MKFLCLILAWFLQLFLSNCADYISLDQESTQFPPVIDMNHMSPHPSRLTNAISIGPNCKGQIFKIPPILDNNKNDRLYYLWFIDGKLIEQMWIIEPENRSKAIITMTIDEQFLLSHFETKVPQTFFETKHILEFFVSDISYSIPETRFIESNSSPQHVDYAYWIIEFKNEAC